MAIQPTPESHRDFTCEILGIAVLMVLSAISHFWYLMIGFGVLAAVVVAAVSCYVLALRARTEILQRLAQPVALQNTGRNSA